MIDSQFEDLRRSKRVLISSADTRLVEVSVRFYRRRGYDAFGAGSPTETLAVAKEKAPQVILLSTDTDSNDLPGLIAALKNLDRYANVILFARDEQSELIKNAWRSGAFYFLRQGASPRDIIPELERAFDDYFARVQIRYLQKFVFVLMPFSPTFADVYELGIKAAVTDCGLVCERADEQHFTDPIVDAVFRNIRHARFVVVDMTTQNPNVFFELGYAFALGKPIILLTRDSAETIPFDLRHVPIIVYEGRITLLRERLRSRLGGLLESSVGLT